MGLSPSTSTDLILRPTMSRSRSRRNTSISGSSGTRVPLLQTRPGDPRRRLLGFLLRVPLACARRFTVEHHGREEPLRMVGPLVTDEIAGPTKSSLCRELLQARLVVAPTRPGRGLADAIVEQIEDEAARGVETTVEVDGGDQCFERVGEDRLLRATTARVFTLAEQ